MERTAASSEDYYGSERADMLAFVPAAARAFLDVGCAAGRFGALLKRSRPGARVVGIEVVAEPARLARGRLDEVIEAPVEAAIGTLAAGSFDCITCNDVLEHLVDPWAALRTMRLLLRPGGVVVASIPNVRFFPVFRAYLVEREWRYADDGVLDRTHLRFFTQRSIERLFADSGYRVTTNQGIFPEPLKYKAALLNFLTRGLLDDMRYQRFAVVAAPVARIDNPAAAGRVAVAPPPESGRARL